jgi:hypothetical protein
MMPESRQIDGLKWAHPLSERPDCIPTSRPRGAKAAGLRFERAFAKHLPSALHGTWFEFEDRNGHGYCQTDLIYSLLPRFLAIIEIKYTLVPGAFSKLTNFYIPIVAAALDRPAAGVVVVKNLDPRYRRGRIYTDLELAARDAHANHYPTLLQWVGQAVVRSPSSVRAKPSATSEGVRAKPVYGGAATLSPTAPQPPLIGSR